LATHTSQAVSAHFSCFRVLSSAIVNQVIFSFSSATRPTPHSFAASSLAVAVAVEIATVAFSSASYR